MTRKTRLIIAAIVTLILAVTATTVWAGSNRKDGSLGAKIHHLTGQCNAGVNMGDATFNIIVDEKVICTFDVTRTKVPNAQMGQPPFGMEFRSDGFIVSGGPAEGVNGVLEVCFAYSPQDAEKNAKIFMTYGTESTLLPAAKQGTPAQLCAATGVLNATFAMVGTP
jgi:hypothetical protein